VPKNRSAEFSRLLTERRKAGAGRLDRIDAPELFNNDEK
jgi:hypothetical protein